MRSSLLALALPLCMGTGWYGLAMAASSCPEEFHGAQRRLLGTVLQVTQLPLPVSLWAGGDPVMGPTVAGRQALCGM